MLFADLCRFHLLCSRVKDWINHIFVQFSTCLRMKWSVVYGSSTSFCDKDVLRCIYMDTCDTWGFGKESRPNLLHLYQHGLEGHSRDPALERNIVRGSGKSTISWRGTGFDRYSGNEICQKLGMGRGIGKENDIWGSRQCRRFLWTRPQGLLFLLSIIFLCHKMKYGGFNSTNINKKLSPA